MTEIPHPEDNTSPETGAEYGMQDMAHDMARWPAELQIHARRLLSEQGIDEPGPTADETVAGRAPLGQLRDHILHNLTGDRTARDPGLVRLYDHQESVLTSVRDFIQASDSGEAESLWGYIQMPTGTGKTGIFTSFIEAVNKPTPDDAAKLKTLVLVPKLDLLAQTVGKSEEDANKRGFAKFAADTDVTEYYGARKDLSGDAVVMTYRSFNKAVHEDRLPKDLFDILILDEAHNALGHQTQHALRQYGQNKLVLGLTATSEYGVNKKLESLLPARIHTMHVREAVEESLLAPVRGIAVRPDQKIETISAQAADFTDEELAVLIHDSWRNQKAVQFAKEFVDQGRQGIISCVPGGQLAHARLIADELNQSTILGNDGEPRPIKAAAVGSMMTSEERTRIYEAYENGDIDVLTYVDVLTEGWDSERAKFLINLRPTTSPVSAVQRLGRVLRPYEDDMATIVEFIDRSDKPQFTVFHALGIEKIDSRVVYGPGRHGGEDAEPDDALRLSPELAALVAEVDHKLISELIVQPPEHELAPGGVMSLSNFGRQYGISSKTISRLAQEAGIEPVEYAFGKNHRYALGLTPEEQALLLSHPFFAEELAPPEVSSLYGFAESNGYGRSMVEAMVEELKLDLDVYRFGSNRVEAFGLTAEQQAQLITHIETTAPAAPEGTESVNTFYRSMNSSMPMIYQLCDELGIKVGRFRMTGDSGMAYITPALTVEQQEQLKAHPYFQAPELTDAVVLLGDVAEQVGTGSEKLRFLLDQSGITPDLYRSGGRRVLGLSRQQYEDFKKYLGEASPEAAGLASRISELAKEHGASPQALLKFAAERGITFTSMRFPSKRGWRTEIGLTQEDTRKLLADPIFKVPRLRDDQLPLERAALTLGISPATLAKKAAQYGVEPATYRNGLTRTGLAFTGDQLETIRQADPTLSSQDVVEEAVTLKMVGRELNSDPTKIAKIMESLGIQPVQTLAQGRLVPALRPEDIERVKNDDYFKIAIAEEHGAVSLDRLTRELGVSISKLNQLMADSGIEAGRYRFGSGKGMQIGNGLSAEEIVRIRDHQYFKDLAPIAPDDVMSLPRLAESAGVSTKKINSVLRGLDIQPASYRFGKNRMTGIGLNAEEQAAVLAVLATS